MVKHIYDISNIINKLRLIQSLLFSYPDTEEKISFGRSCRCKIINGIIDGIMILMNCGGGYHIKMTNRIKDKNYGCQYNSDKTMLSKKEKKKKDLQLL